MRLLFTFFLLLLIAGPALAIDCGALTSARERQHCLDERVKLLLDRSLNQAVTRCTPGVNGSQDATCYRNTVDSTCRYADGTPAPGCGQPDCAYESYEYGTGSGPGRCGRCPPHTDRAGLPPDERGSCNDAEEPPFVGGGGDPGTRKGGFYLAPGGSASEGFVVAVPPGYKAGISGTAELEVAGDPAGDLANFFKRVAGTTLTLSEHSNAEVTSAMDQAIATITSGGTVTLEFKGSGWAVPVPNCGGNVPTPPSVSQSDAEWGGGVSASIQGGSACGSYGQVRVTGTIKNGTPVREKRTYLETVSAKGVPEGCPGDPFPMQLPIVSSAEPGPGASPTIEVAGKQPLQLSCVPNLEKETYACGTSVIPKDCEREVQRGWTDTTRWAVSYGINAPSIKVTGIDVSATGSEGVSYP